MDRLKQEAECCATISVIYADSVSNLHSSEPKYTIQDMVIIISGNIEAWIGLSAVHTYLFLEQLYDALLEANLVSPLSTIFTCLRVFKRGRGARGGKSGPRRATGANDADRS